MTHEPPNAWGSCFDAAAFNLLANKDEKGLRMCHGIGIANKPGQEGTRIAHAWLECELKMGRVALDPVWLVFQSADLYRYKLQVERVVEYTFEDFMHFWKEHGFPGPWDEEIRKCTSDASDSPL